MNLLELKKIIDQTVEASNEDPSKVLVGIPNNKESTWGDTPITEIRHAYRGFDWDANIFLLSPKIPMKEMTLKDKLENI